MKGRIESGRVKFRRGRGKVEQEEVAADALIDIVLYTGDMLRYFTIHVELGLCCGETMR